jgi:GNAT superfamily N-acetyltransferase
VNAGVAASTPAGLAHLVEHAEANAWADLQESLPAPFRHQLGVAVVRAHGGVCLIAAHSPALAINRALGFGFEQPLSLESLDAVIASYAAANVATFILQWSPEAQPPDAADMLTARGFVRASHIAKMVRQLSDAADVEPRSRTLTIREIGREHALVFEQIVAQPLGVPPGLEIGVRSTLGKPAWRFYLAFDGDRPIAGAALYIRGDHAWCGLGATIEEARGRGAQTALIERRLHDAAAAGCRWISADTLVGVVPGSVQSRRNLERLGFTTLYERPNYLLKMGARPSADAPEAERR